MRHPLLVTFTVFAMGMLPLAAQQSKNSTLTIAVTGTLGPVLEGSDPLHASGHTGSLTLIISDSATPAKVATNSVEYTVPAGAITDVIGVSSYTTTTPGKMAVTLTPAADVLTVIYNSRDNTVTTLIAYLAPGSWSTSVFINPQPFSPSPQDLTAATVAGGRGTQLQYTLNGALTVLGMQGTISSSAPPDPILPDLIDR
jgi:hypothetical protein